jgi:serine/threonine-protein kinase
MPNLARRQLRTEARVASRVSHHNIVSVIDYDESDELPFLVMERVHGVLLGDLLDSAGPLSVRGACEIMTQLLAALGESHVHGVVHGDVKSDNVLVTPQRDGRTLARLFDFGLARTGDDEACSDDGMLFGTPEYIAPELARGHGPTIASDLYAAGVVLYELLTGTAPFTGNCGYEILSRHLCEDVTPPSRRRQDLDRPGIDTLVMRALAKEPEARFQSAVQFARTVQSTMF